MVVPRGWGRQRLWSMSPEGAALGGRTPSTAYPAALLERQDLLEPKTQRHPTQLSHQNYSLCLGAEGLRGGQAGPDIKNQVLTKEVLQS